MTFKNKKIIYNFKNFIKILRFQIINKHINEKNFHKIILNDAAMVICENEFNEVLLLREFRVGLNKLSWGLPGGMLNKKEDFKKAAIRELYEETGIKIKNCKLILKYIRDGNYFSGKEYCYYSKIKKKMLNIHKNSKFKWAKKSELIKMLKNNKFETPGIQSCILNFVFKSKL